LLCAIIAQTGSDHQLYYLFSIPLLHFTVTEAVRRRMDTADAMAMTGHRNYETFMGYYRAEDPLNREASRMLDDADPVA
jgi:hypothetical protein